MEYKVAFKEIKEYLISLLWFFISIKYCFILIGVVAILILYPIGRILDLIIFHTILFLKQYQTGIILNEFEQDALSFNSMEITATFLGLYLISKVFGIFKKLDKLNFFVSLFIVLIISYLLFSMSKINIDIVILCFILALSYLVFKFFKLLFNRKKMDKFDFFLLLIFNIIIIWTFCVQGKQIFKENGEFFYEICIQYANTMYLLIPAFLTYKFFGFLTRKFPFPFKKIEYYTSIEFLKVLLFKIKKIIKKRKIYIICIKNFTKIAYKKTLFYMEEIKNLKTRLKK